MPLLPVKKKSNMTTNASEKTEKDEEKRIRENF